MTDDTEARAREMARTIWRAVQPADDNDSMCRDCADASGVCPSTGLVCDIEAAVVPLVAPLFARAAAAERERDEARGKLIAADEDAKISRRFMEHSDRRAEAAEARAAGLRRALERIAAIDWREDEALARELKIGGGAKCACNIAFEALAADQAGDGEEAYRVEREPRWATALWRFLLSEYAAPPDSGDVVTADVRPHFNALCAFIANQAFAPPQPATAGAPEGWRLVPVEPTEAMRHAGGLTLLDDDDVLAVTSHEAEQTYTAMLDAAPAAPSPAPDGRVRELETWLRQARKFMDDAPRLDFNEDRTLSWVAFACARIDALLAKEPSHGR